MIDAEVLRLRKLRNTALRARAIAAALEANPGSARRMLSASAAGCWRIARIISGRLRAHPYPKYQRGASRLRGASHRVSASVLAAIARYRGRTLQAVSDELLRVVRELDDARAVTWSAELSDTFGRSQLQIRRLIKELDAAARDQGALRHAGAGLVEPRVESSVDDGAAAANWPYLAF